MTTAIQSRSLTTTEEVRAFCRLNTGDYDSVLEGILEAAKVRADLYCGNDFLKSDGTKGPIPADVELWLKQFCLTVFQNPALGMDSVNTWNAGSKAFITKLDDVYNSMKDGLKGHRRRRRFSTR